MEFKLTVHSFPKARIDRNQDNANFDDVRSLIANICEGLEGNVDFKASGFGQDLWPVDVRTDLMTFMEQLPKTLHNIRNRKDCTIDLYEQGMERILHFKISDNICRITCNSGTDWKPTPATETISITMLDRMLDEVLQKFICLAKTIVPEIQTNEWFINWVNGEFEA